MDTQLFDLIKSLADNVTTLAILGYVAYQLMIALKDRDKAEKDALERYISHLEQFHPSPQKDN